MNASSIVHLRKIRDEIGQDVFAEVMNAFAQEMSASLDRFERAVVAGCGTRPIAAHRLSGALHQFGLSWAAADIDELSALAATSNESSRQLLRIHARVRSAIRLARRIRAEEPIQAGEAQNEPKVTL